MKDHLKKKDEFKATLDKLQKEYKDQKGKKDADNGLEFLRI